MTKSKIALRVDLVLLGIALAEMAVMAALAFFPGVVQTLFVGPPAQSPDLFGPAILSATSLVIGVVYLLSVSRDNEHAAGTPLFIALLSHLAICTSATLALASATC